MPYLRDVASAGETEKLIRFVRIHLDDWNEDVGTKRVEAIKILSRYTTLWTKARSRPCFPLNESTLALL